MSMDQQKVKKLAEEFESVAHKYGADSHVDKLLGALKELLLKAKAGSITAVIEHVPGEYFFQEGELSMYTDLEAAYSKLKLALVTEDKKYNDLKAWAEKRKQELFDKK
jgi:hypothetical protein